MLIIFVFYFVRIVFVFIYFLFNKIQVLVFLTLYAYAYHDSEMQIQKVTLHFMNAFRLYLHIFAFVSEYTSMSKAEHMQKSSDLSQIFKPVVASIN
jgi:hypothetical protein